MRNKAIDIARGIAMICIVLGHLGNSDINRVVFTFHLPIFYLISGYFLDTSGTDLAFFRKKAKSLIQPYYLTCLLVCLFSVGFSIYFHQDWASALNRWILASLYGAGDNWEKPFVIIGIGAIWFLWATFWAEVILRWLIRHVRPLVRVCLIIILFLASVYSARLIWLPLSIQAGGCALLFLYIGWLIRSTRLSNVIRSNREVLLFGIAAAIFLWIWFVRHFVGFWLVHAYIGNGAVDIVGSLCGCWLLLLISKGIDDIPVISDLLGYLGKYSLIFLSMHLIELNTFPWEKLYGVVIRYFGVNHTLFLIIVKLLWIIPMTLLLSSFKPVRKLYGYRK